MKKLGYCLLFFAGVLWGCENNARQQHEGNQYYYYPSKNLYYDVANHRYLFSLDSGKTWDSLHSETAEPAIDGEKQVIYSSSVEVWQNNDMHREEYKGKMLNIINEESLRQPEPLIAKKTISKTSDEEDNQEVKKERKRPIKRFFQKIFGKKKEG